MNESEDLLSVPMDVDAERILLSTLVAPGATGGTSNDKLITDLDLDIFFSAANRSIAGALKAILSRHGEVTIPAISTEIEARGELELVGGRPGIYDLVDGMEVSHPEELVTRLQEQRDRRRVMRLAGRSMRIAADPMVSIDEVRESCSELAEVTALAQSARRNLPLIDMTISGPELGQMKIQPCEMIVAPFIASGSLSMVYAARGLGKTFFAIALAVSVTTGQPFFEWHTSKARRVLFIDGEMQLEMLQERFSFLYGGNISERLDLLPSETLWTRDKPLNLNEVESQARIQQLLVDLDAADRRPDLIIIDNLSSLSFGGDENDNNMQESVLRWLMGLRHQGFAVLLVHHAGKGGDQRGASRREDFLDTTIRLARPDSEIQGDGAAFKIEFTKERGRKAIPGALTVALETGQHGEAVWARPRSMPEYMKALLAINEHHPDNFSALGKVMDISRQGATKHCEALREKGLLQPLTFSLTGKGNKAIRDLKRWEVA